MKLAEEMFKKSEEIDASIWSVLSELLPPDRMRTLMGAHILHHGFEGLMNERILQTLRVDDGQRSKLAVAIEEEKKSRRKVLAEVATGRSSEGSKKRLSLREETLVAAVAKSLSQSQRDQLLSMTQAGAAILPKMRRISFGW